MSDNEGEPEESEEPKVCTVYPLCIHSLYSVLVRTIINIKHMFILDVLDTVDRMQTLPNYF